MASLVRFLLARWLKFLGKDSRKCQNVCLLGNLVSTYKTFFRQGLDLFGGMDPFLKSLNSEIEVKIGIFIFQGGEWMILIPKNTYIRLELDEMFMFLKF